MAVLDTVKEFAHTVMKPITLDDLKLFMDQGWSLELLLYMIVESGQIHDITVKDGNVSETQVEPFEELLGPVCANVGRKVKNAAIDPGKQRDASASQHAWCFKAIVDYLARGELPPDIDKKFDPCPEVRAKRPRGARLRIVRDFSGEIVSPELPKTDLNDVKKVAEVSKMGFSFIEVGDAYRLCETAVSSRFCIIGVQDCVVSDTRAKACEAAKAAAYNKGNAAARRAQLAVQRSEESGVESMLLEVPLSCPQNGESPKTRFTFSAQLRSLQGMIYYAGEIIRNQQLRSSTGDPSQTVPQYCISGLAPGSQTQSGATAYRPLMQVETGASPSDAAISVVYQGIPYWIRSGEQCSDSLSVVALLTQIQALYQSRAEIPASQTILSID